MLKTAKYNNCAFCFALNMTHRDTCYRCRKPLGQESSSAAPASPGTAGPAPMIRTRGSRNGRLHARRSLTICNVLLEGEVPIRHRVVVADISAGGLQMRTTVPCRVGARVRLHLPIEGRLLLVEGAIRYGAPVQSESGRSLAYGVQFVEPYPQLRALLSGVSELQAGIRT